MTEPAACDHDCYLCVTEARCERGHLAALGVCDRHICMVLDPAVGFGLSEREAVGEVMRMTGGRANPQRAAELFRTSREWREV